MVIFDIGAAFLVGGALAKRTGGQCRDLALVAGGLGCGAPGLFFLESYPDWDWQYLIDPSTLPSGTPALFITFILVASLLGHWVGTRSKLGLLTSASVYGLYCLASLPRIPFVGTRAEYFAGEAPFLPSPFLVHLALVGGAACGILGMCWFLVERSRMVDIS